MLNERLFMPLSVWRTSKGLATILPKVGGCYKMDKTTLNDCCGGEKKSGTLSSDDFKSSLSLIPCSYEDYLQNNTYDLSNILENIHFLVKQHGVNIEEVEDGAGLRRGYIARMESSKVTPRANVVMAVAAFLDIPVDDLVFLNSSYRGNADDLILKDFFTQIIEDTKRKVINWDKGSREYYEGNKYSICEPPREFSELSKCISGSLVDIEEEYYAYHPRGTYNFRTDIVYVVEIDAGIVTLIGGVEEEKPCENLYSLTLKSPGGRECEIANTAQLNQPLSNLLNMLVEEVEKAFFSVNVNEDVLAPINAFIGCNDDDIIKMNFEDCMEEYENGGDD